MNIQDNKGEGVSQKGHCLNFHGRKKERQSQNHKIANK